VRIRQRRLQLKSATCDMKDKSRLQGSLLRREHRLKSGLVANTQTPFQFVASVQSADTRPLPCESTLDFMVHLGPLIVSEGLDAFLGATHAAYFQLVTAGC
jgi:hypothetical protein